MISSMLTNKLNATVFSLRILAESAILSIWFALSQASSYLTRARDSNSQITEDSNQRRRHRPRQLDLSSCQQRRMSLNIFVAGTYSPFRTPLSEIIYKDDPFLRVVRTTNINSPLSPQFTKLAKSLEMQLGMLPHPWSMRLSSDKRIYFVNLQSGETTWQDPRLISAGVASTPAPILNGTFQCRDPERLTPVSPRPTHINTRISQWVAEEQSKVRARNAKLVALRTRARMAKMQKYMQPLAL